MKLVQSFDHHAGEITLTYDASHNRTVLQGYTNTDNTPDLTIYITGDHRDFAGFTL